MTIPTPDHAPSAAETFLTAFHDARAGATSRAYGELPVLFHERTVASSYEVLAATVKRTDEPIRVLDLACGDGFLLALLAARQQPGLELAGVDMSAGELQAARARLGAEVILQQGRAQALDFPTGHFDVVLCHMALMLMDDAEAVLREIRRVLKPGATLAAIVGAPKPPSPAFSSYLEALLKPPRLTQFAEVRIGDRRFRSPDGIRAMLAPGFCDVAIDELTITQRLTPEALWHWYFEMYDLHLMSQADREAVRQEYFASMPPHCGADGRIEHIEQLRYVVATSA